MIHWDDFRAKLEAITDPGRLVEAARIVIATYQRQLADDPPDWLLRMAGSRAMQATEGVNEWVFEPLDPAQLLATTPRIATAGLRARELEERATRAERRAAEAEQTAEAAVRTANRRAAEPLVDEAVRDGRVSAGRRNRILAGFERNFELAAEMLAELEPDLGRRYANAWDAEADAAEQAAIAREFGLDEREVA